MIYLENNLYFWVSNVQPEFVTLPRVTICIDRPPISSNSTSNKESAATIDQLFKRTINFDKIYEKTNSFVVSPSTMSLTPILDLYRFEKQLTPKEVCFTTFGPEHFIGNCSHTHYPAMQIDLNYYFRIYLKNNLPSSKVKVYLHLYDSFNVNSGDFDSLEIVTKRPRTSANLWFFYLKETKLVLLSDKLESNCVDYKKLGFRSRSDAVKSCTTSLLKNKYKLWPNDTPVNETEGQGLRFAEHKDQSTFIKLNNYCINKFHRPSCESSFVSLSIYDSGFDKNLALILYPPLEDYNEIKEDMRYSLVELIVLIGGNINTWTGIAVLHVFQLVIRRFYRK